MLNTPTSVDSLPRLRRFNPSQTQSSSFAYLGHNERPGEVKDSAKSKEETLFNAGESAKEKEEERAESNRDVQQPKTAEVLHQPVQSNTDRQVQGEPQERSDLVEVPLSEPKPPLTAGEGDMGGEQYREDQKMCCGFFFKVNDSSKDSIFVIALVFLLNQHQSV